MPSAALRFGRTTRRARSLIALAGLALLTACGTAYELPEVTSQSRRAAEAVFRAEAELGPGRMRGSPSRSQRNTFETAVARINPAARTLCQEYIERSEASCDYIYKIDESDGYPNASQQRGPEGRPLVTVTKQMIATARNTDELAFVLAHETAHHIAGHLDRRTDQAVAGALAAGLLAVAIGANGGLDYAGSALDVGVGVVYGAGIGGTVYSRRYELEADMIGALVARKAGYDPVVGARIFARPNPFRGNSPSTLWDTHPSNIERYAMVLEAVERFERDGDTLTPRRTETPG